MTKMRFSVITICYNEEHNIAKTIESVLSQTSNDFEYLICDGNSKDRTVDVAKSYIEKFEAKGINFRIFSESDGGIYFGMNNGIDRAHGDYLMFLNAGDHFYDNDVLLKISNYIKDKAPEVVYGDCLFVERCVGIVCKTDHNQLKQYMSLAHPSILVRSDIIKNNKFNTGYRIAADYNMMLDLYMKNVEFLYLDLLISVFYLDGISSVRNVETAKELCSIQISHGLDVDEKQVIKKAIKKKFRLKFYKIIPLFFWRWWNKSFKKRIWIEG